MSSLSTPKEFTFRPICSESVSEDPLNAKAVSTTGKIITTVELWMKIMWK